MTVWTSVGRQSNQVGSPDYDNIVTVGFYSSIQATETLQQDLDSIALLGYTDVGLTDMWTSVARKATTWTSDTRVSDTTWTSVARD